MKTSSCLLASLLLISATKVDSQEVQKAAQAPDCQANQLSLRTDSRDGEFTGMSQSGTLLIVRNSSPDVCRLQPTLDLSFKDTHNKPLKVVVKSAETAFHGPVVNGKPMPMGHGPVVLPIAMKSGAEATCTLRWVTGAVYTHSVCVDTGFLNIRIGAEVAETPMGGHICGPDADHIQVKATRLTLSAEHKP